MIYYGQKKQLIETIERLDKKNLDLTKRLSYRDLQVQNRNTQIRELKKKIEELEINTVYKGQL